MPRSLYFILALYKTVSSGYCFQNLFTGTQAGGTESDSFSTSLHGQQTDLQSCFILGRVYKWGCAFPWAIGNTPTQLCSICIELQSLRLLFLGCRPTPAGLKTPLNKSENHSLFKKTHLQSSVLFIGPSIFLCIFRDVQYMQVKCVAAGTPNT